MLQKPSKQSLSVVAAKLEVDSTGKFIEKTEVGDHIHIHSKLIRFSIEV